MMFWIENSVIIMVFLAYEMALVPFAYLKTFINIIHDTDIRLFRKIFMLLSWVVIGIPTDLCLICYDLKIFIIIIANTSGFKDAEVK